MKLRDYVRLGWDQLRRRKVVTALCAMGIAIGSSSIIVALAFGESVTYYSKQQMMQYMKTDEITVMKRQTGGAGGMDPSGSPGSASGSQQQGISDQLIDIIRGLPHVKTVASQEQLGMMEFRVDDTKRSHVNLTATELNTLEAFGNEFAQGAARDEENVIILNYGATMGLYDERTERMRAMQQQQQETLNSREVRDEYIRQQTIVYPLYQKQLILSDFGGGGPQGEAAGRKLEIPVRVVGVLKKPEGMDDRMLMHNKIGYISPALARKINDFRSGLNGNEASSTPKGIQQLTVKADSSANVKELEELLRKLPLDVNTNLYMEEQMKDQFVIIRLVFGGVGLFVLFVASISIVVAMTMSTYQRRRQIGIMKVLGSSLGQIRNMFIVESALLGLLGGLCGIVLSYWVIWAINIVVNHFSGGMDEQLLFISLWILPVGLFFALLTGIISGIYPAVKASRTDALTAIKRE
ncbi:ABC transporter permease [Paenibacillus sp. y28]|uniref:ABC transporter permease n=1 Tax=Paenibacillus sp. y28 TaxID=3129110 RepID=UPI003017A80A